MPTMQSSPRSARTARCLVACLVLAALVAACGPKQDGGRLDGDTDGGESSSY